MGEALQIHHGSVKVPRATDVSTASSNPVVCTCKSRDNDIGPNVTREFSECLALGILAILQSTVMTSRPRHVLPNWVRVREPKYIVDVTNFTFRSASHSPAALIARFPIHRIAHP